MRAAAVQATGHEGATVSAPGSLALRRVWAAWGGGLGRGDVA